MGGNDEFHDAEAQPTAADRARHALVYLVKAFENAFGFARREADAIVFHGEGNASVISAGAQSDLLVIAGIFVGVIEKVDEGSDESVGIRNDGGKGRWRLEFQPAAWNIETVLNGSFCSCEDFVRRHRI